MPASTENENENGQLLPSGKPQPVRSDAHAPALDDEMLMLFEDGLRAHLPKAEDIIERAALRKRRTRNTLAIAAVTALSATLFWLDPVYRSEQIATAVGERHVWTLNDGSEVALNTDSRLRVDFHLRSRQLHLTQGEALFKVEHSRWRTFLVYANQTIVRDIGTVFNVRNTAWGAQVTVLEGQVQVMMEGDPEQARVLDADQSLEVGNGRPFDAHHVDAGLATLWHNGKLHFDNTRLADVVEELQRYRAAPISLAPALADLRITGQFDINRIDQLLTMLPTLAPVTVRRGSDGSILIERVNGRHAAASAPP